MRDERILQTACIHDYQGFCILIARVRVGLIERLSSYHQGPDTLLRRQFQAYTRGRAYRQRVYHPERLLCPLIRMDKLGDARSPRAPWMRRWR